MKTSKKILMRLMVMLMLGCFASILHAQEIKTLVLWHTDGTTTDVELYTQPNVQFRDEQVIITSPVLNLQYPQQDIARFTYKGTGTGIDAQIAPSGYSQKDGQLVFRGLNPTDKVEVYSTNGNLVSTKIFRTGNSITLSLSALPSGVYLLKVNGKTSKFIKP